MHNSKFSSSLKCFMPLHFPPINEEHDLGALLCSLVFFFCCLNNKVTAVEFFCCCLSLQQFVCWIFGTRSLKEKILLLKQLMSRHMMFQHRSIQVVSMLWDLLRRHPPLQLLLGVSMAELSILALFGFAATILIHIVVWPGRWDDAGWAASGREMLVAGRFCSGQLDRKALLRPWKAAAEVAQFP